MSHSNPEPPRPGARFRLATTIERFDHFIAPAGRCGTVIDADENVISLHLDEYLPGAETWNNEVAWTPEHDFDSAGRPAAQPSAAAAFYRDVVALLEPALPAEAQTPSQAQAEPFERDPREGSRIVRIPASNGPDGHPTQFEVSHLGRELGRACYAAQEAHRGAHWYAVTAQERFVNRTQDPAGITLKGSRHTGESTREAAIGLLLAAHIASLP